MTAPSAIGPPGSAATPRNLAIAAVVAGWIGGVLALDTLATLGEQRALGVGTWLLLAALLSREPVRVRVQVGIVVVFATAIEFTFAGWLGTYVYRLHNVPWFVPPGHGLVYLGALALGRSAAFSAARRPLVAATLTVGGAYAVWGVAVSPRTDALGAFWFCCLAAFLLWGRTPLVYVGAFLMVTYLELMGTGLGTWTWGTHDPILGVVAMGNPPSGAAGGYGFFDAAALAFAPSLERLFRRTDLRPHPCDDHAQLVDQRSTTAA